MPLLCRTNDPAARRRGWIAHTPQPDDPPPPGPDEPDTPPIGDPPPEPGEVPHSMESHPTRGGATVAPTPLDRHNFYVLVTSRSTFLPAI